MSTTIDSLEIQIKTQAGSSAVDIDALATSLSNLNKSSNLTKVTNNLTKLSGSLTSLKTALTGMPSMKPLEGLMTSLSGIQKLTNLNSAINTLKKIPEITKSIDSTQITQFTQRMSALAKALDPLATKINQVSAGFAKLPTQVSKTVTAVNRMGSASRSAAESQGKLNHGLDATNINLASVISNLQTYWSVIQQVGRAIGTLINHAIEWDGVQARFGRAFGDSAEGALEQVEKISESLRINKLEFMQYTSLFSEMLAGFGVNQADANKMAFGYTELAYDIWAAYNDVYKKLDGEDGAIAAVRSAIAGEVEPIRRAGFTIVDSQLAVTAAMHGVEYSTQKATEAQKSYLRYLTLVDQATKKGLVGVYAAEMVTAEGAVRTFNQQLKSLWQSLGSLFIPILQVAVPWLSAFVELLTEAVAAIAEFFGIPFFEIDWSRSNAGLGNIETGAEGAGNALNEATEAAKKLKDYTMGFDELNIINPVSSSTGGAGGGPGTGGGAGWDSLPVDSIWDDTIFGQTREQIDEIKKKLEPLLKKITKFAKAGLLLAAIVKVYKKIKSLWTWFTGLKIVDSFLTGFSLIKVTGGNLLQSLRGGIDNIRMNLTGTQKAAIGVVAAVAEFAIIKDSVKELAMGSADVAEHIASIGVAATVAAGAMYVAFGPAGLALAAIVGITAAVVGFGQAQVEMRQNAVDSAFFDGVGTSLDAYREKLELVTGEYATQNETIVGLAEQMKKNDSVFETSTQKIEVLGTTLGTTGVVTKEEAQKIKDEFAVLYSAIESNMSLSSEVINSALVGALKRATPEISAEIDLLIGEYQRYVRETQGRAAELKMLIENGYDQLVGKQKDDPAYQEIMEKINGWYSELGYLSGGMSDAAWQWDQTVDAFNNNEIDFGDSVEDAKAKVGEIAQVGEKALSDLAIARDTALKEIDAQIKYAAKYGSLEEVEMLGDIRAHIADDYASQEQAIKGEINAIFESIQTGMINKIDGAKKTLEAEWDEMTWMERWWYDQDEEKYVYQGLQDLQGHVDEISDAIQGHMDTLETKGSAWADDAMQGILDALFESKVTRNDLTGSTSRYSYAMDLEDAIKQVFSELEKSGVKKAKETSETIVSDGFGSTFSTDVASSIGTTFAKDVVSAFNKSIRNADFATIKANTSVNSSSGFGNIVGHVSFGGYAQGGFPSVGQMFIAREAGPELVGSINGRTAVANNDQIVTAVSQGVYSAVVAAMGASAPNEEQAINVYLDGKQITAAVEKRQKERGATLMTGGMAYGY